MEQTPTDGIARKPMSRDLSAALCCWRGIQKIGVLHDEFRPPIRSLPHGSHRLFYDVEPGRIIIMRVLHKSVDVGRWVG